MRVIAGEFRSRRLGSLPGMEIRPTSDRLRETLFDVLGNTVEGAEFVDAYAGTGAVGIEALSRGARRVVFLEKNRQAADLIASNLESLGVESRAHIIRGSAPLYLGGLSAEIVFIDPPFSSEHEYTAALEALTAKPPHLVVVQHSTHFPLQDTYGPLVKARTIRQGDNVLSFFRPHPQDERCQR